MYKPDLNRTAMTELFETKGNKRIEREAVAIEYQDAIEHCINRLDQERGLVFSSNVEFPGRYTSWDIAVINPPLEISSQGDCFTLSALNARGEVLLAMILPLLKEMEELKIATSTSSRCEGRVIRSKEYVPEHLRSKQPSIFSLLRAIQQDFFTEQDAYLGLYGAFGYDMAFQFEPIRQKLSRDKKQRDMVLYFMDEVIVVDHRRCVANHFFYDVSFAEKSTKGLPRESQQSPFKKAKDITKKRSHKEGEYAETVKQAKAYFKRGDLFEAVPGQSFYHRCDSSPASLFLRLRATNPSPYSFIFNLGENEFLVGASPEMYVRVKGRHVETRPISGTIKRGKNALEDAKNIQTLINSRKDESELTMCTDVDRNDKSRICVPGSVSVTGRREIEKYSTLFHTVDHVEGTLDEGYDAFDAFLTHMWAVTVTGAPKRRAMQFVEDVEKTPRKWYAGAIGWLNFNGNMNTGLTIRTLQIKEGIAEVRVGATLLYDSIPEEEEAETVLKASGMMKILGATAIKKTEQGTLPPLRKQVLLIDHDDSFVHTLANYFRQQGASVTTVRYMHAEEYINKINPDLVVFSPGPGKPSDFDLNTTIALLLQKEIPIFGVCLGLQGLVEYFGGVLKTLDYPVHGKPSEIALSKSDVFTKLPEKISVGRYHSIYTTPDNLPDCLTVTASTEDGVVMAIDHVDLPIAAVQFHPESILSATQEEGMTMIRNILEYYA
jgi:anthranilate synthase